MKKFISVLIIFCSFTCFTNCSKKDASPGSDNSIVGVWNLTAITEMYYKGGKLVGSHSDEITGVKTEFKSDGTYKSTTDGESDEMGYYKYTNGAKTFEGKEITEAGYTSYAIDELSGNKFVLRFSFPVSNDATMDSETDVITFTR